MKRLALLLAVGVLGAGVADAKPKKARAAKNAPKKAKAKGKAKVDEPAPTPDPEPAPTPEPVATTPEPAPAPVAVTSGKPRIAVIGDSSLAPSVAKALEGRFEIVSAEGGDPKSVAAKHSLHAVVVVSSGSTSTAIAYQGSDGAELARAEIKGGKFIAAKKLGPEAADKLSPKITSATAPSTETVAAASSSSSSSGSASDTGIVASVRPQPRPRRDIVIAVEERPFWRRLRYNDDLDGRLRPSDLVANAVGVGASWRPLAKLRNLSVHGRGELAVGVNGSRTPDGTEYSTHSSEWSLGIGFDVRIATTRVGLAVAYGEQRFSIGDDPAMELVPDVTYRYARGGLVVETPLGSRWELTFTGGWRRLLGLGGMTEAAWFPRATGAGIDGSAGIAFHATPWLDVQARVDLRRYFFAMNPEPGDPWIAGGATDQYVGGALGLAISPR